MGWADLIINALNKGKRIDNIIGREEIASIFNAAKRLEHIIDEYLDLGRLEGKRLVLNKKTLNLVKLLAEALKNVEMLARASNITIHVNVEDVILDVDGFRIEQVFINILSNAIKYSPPDKEIWVTTIKDDSSLKIFFTDQGCGFTMEELKGIWRPFANLASRRKKGMPTGTGIGLYLSKGLVEMHGGTIEIFSDGADKGSRVEISLPLKTQAEKEFALKESLAKN
jgi:signal transduction histidine kinase